MKLLIEISEEAKQAFDCAESNDLKASYYDLGGVIGAAIKNGKPLDSMLNEIRAEIDQEYNRLSATSADETLELGECLGLKMALKILNKYMEESEEK